MHLGPIMQTLMQLILQSWGYGNSEKLLRPSSFVSSVHRMLFLNSRELVFLFLNIKLLHVINPLYPL